VQVEELANNLLAIFRVGSGTFEQLGFAILNRSANRLRNRPALSRSWLSMAADIGRNFQFLLCAHRHAVVSYYFLRDGTQIVQQVARVIPLTKTSHNVVQPGVRRGSGNHQGQLYCAILKRDWRVDHGPDRGAGALLLGILMARFLTHPAVGTADRLGADVALPDAHRSFTQV
jgi:hypothetical protein